MKIAITSDKAGRTLKDQLIAHLSSLQIAVHDFGIDLVDVQAEYRSYLHRLAKSVAQGEFNFGIMVSQSGQDMAIIANRLGGVRAAACQTILAAQQSRAQVNANILCLGVLTPPDQAIDILNEWLKTEYRPGTLSDGSSFLGEQGFTNQLQPAENRLRFSIAMAPQPSKFAPLVFAGRLEEGISALAKSGFSAVEISLRNASDVDAVWLDRIIQRFKLSVSAFASGRICIEDEVCLCNPRPAIRQMAYERLKAIVELGARYQAPLIIGGVRGKFSGDESQRREQRASAVDTLRRCAEEAQKHGTFLLIEPINRYETNFVNNADDALQLVRDISHPAVKILLDTFHMNIEEVDPCTTIRKIGPQLGYIHFADNNRLSPGQGHIDFPSIIHTLTGIGYSGYISSEILPIPDDLTALENAGQYLQTLARLEQHYE